MIAYLLRLVLGGLVAMPAIAGPAAAGGVGSWVAGDNIRARLVIAGPGASPSAPVEAALEIELAPGWKTYWRTPGQGGIPPRFDFGGSANVAAARVLYPAPHRFDDGYAVTNVYSGRVVFPIAVTPAKPGERVRVAVAIDLGVCQAVCVPVRLGLEATGGGRPDAAARAIVEAGLKSLPGAPQRGVFEVVSLKRVGGSEELPEFDLAVVAPAGDLDIFVEGAADWFATVPKATGGDGRRRDYRFKIDRLGSGVAIGGAALRVTLVGAAGAVEQEIRLD